MAWSLELRAPFLDADVIRAAMRIVPTLKLDGPDDAQQKLPHRLLALRRGVPEHVAYRTKAMAQDGANVHRLLERAAARRFPDEPPAVPLVDFGSNYRYRDTPQSYSTPAVRALLAALVAEGDFVVAGANGSAAVAQRTTPSGPLRRPAVPRGADALSRR